MKKSNRIKEVLQVLISLGLGGYVFYLVYKQIDIKEMKSLVDNAHWQYILLPVFLCIFSSWVRALRWNMLIEPVAKVPHNKNTFYAVMIGYFVNHIFPRAGEIARCGALTKSEGIGFSELIGTVIAERAFDLIVTLLIVITTLTCEWSLFSSILASVSITDKIIGMLTHPILWASLALIGILFLLLRKRLQATPLYSKIAGMCLGIWNGLKSFTQVKNKGLFIVYSLLIFFIYYLMLYFSFWVFDFTADLTPGAGLVTYVFGALGMVVPVQGGIGTYEFMTIQALLLYGITETQGGTFAILSHLVEIIVNCVVGFICYIIVFFKGKKE